MIDRIGKTKGFVSGLNDFWVRWVGGGAGEAKGEEGVSLARLGHDCGSWFGKVGV